MKLEQVNGEYFETLADRAGEIKAQMSELSAELKDIKQTFEHYNVTEADGEFYRATLSVTERVSERWKELALSFKPTRQKLKAYETVTPVTTLRVNARKL